MAKSNGHGNGKREESLPTRIARKLIALARLDTAAVAGVARFSDFAQRHVLHALAMKEIEDSRPEIYGLIIALQGARGTPLGEVLGELEMQSDERGESVLRQIAALAIVVRVFDLLCYEAGLTTDEQPAVETAQPAEGAQAAAQPAA